MASSGGEPRAEVEVAGPQRWAGAVAGVAAAAGAVAFLLLAVLGSMPGAVHVVTGVIAVVLGVVAVGSWRGWPVAVPLGILFGGAFVFFGTSALLAVGDAVYDRVPQALDALAPGVLVVVGCGMLAGSAASAPSTGRPGRVVGVVALATGLLLGGVGAVWLLESHHRPTAIPDVLPRPLPEGTTTELDCGSAYHPGTWVGECGEVLRDARDDGRLAIAVGSVLVVLGLGMVVGQLGPAAWPPVAAGAGALAVAAAAWLFLLPLDGGGCNSVSRGAGERPACRDVRTGVGLVVVGLGLTGIALLVVGTRGLVAAVRARSRRGPTPQVSA